MMAAKKEKYLKSQVLSAKVVVLLLACLFILFSCTTQEPRKVHKGCLDCHPELVEKYAAGKVHQPVKEGECKKCHRPHGMVGGVYLRTPQPGLCFECHKSLAKDLSGLTREQLHQPLTKGDCTLCHQPHNSSAEFLLDKAASESCFSCHDKTPFRKSFQHRPLLEGGCRSCHDPHGSTRPHLLIEAETDLCRRCHALEEPKFKARHGNYPVNSACLTCHDVHSADNANLLRPVLHQPVSALECRECHADASPTQPFMLKAEG
ncbi:MAG: cytochrome C, partial [Deltaproteobacteria bacterium]|nr:cytochrome C [Deltaproteobacteria bacterium]